MALTGAMILVAGLSLATGRLTPAQLDSLWGTGQHEAALDALATELVTARRNAEPVALVALLNREAAWRKTSGQPVEGEAAAREALDLAWSTGDSALACAPTRWLSVNLTAQGRNQEAREQYEALLDLATRVGDHEHRGWANIGLGWDDDINRRNRESLRHYAAAAAAFRDAGNPEGELWGQLGVANCRFHLGQYEAAAAAWDSVARTANAAGMVRHEVSTLNNIAGLQFALGRPDVSMGYYQRAIAVWDSLGQQYECLPPRLNLGSCLALLGREDEARELFESILADSRAGELRNYEARALRRLAKLARVDGDIAGASAHFDAVVALGDDLPLLDIIEALRGQASLLDADGRHAEALAILRDAERRLEGDETSAHRTRLHLDLARTLLRLDRTDEAGRYLRRADATLGAARARHGQELAVLQATRWEQIGQPDSALAVLLEAAELWEAERGLPLDPDWREERGAAGRQIFTRLARQLARAQGHEAAFDRLQSYKARTLRERRLGPEALGATDSEPSRSLATTSASELQVEILRPGELLLDAYLGPDESLVFAVSLQACRLVMLPSDSELQPRLRRWHDQLASPHSPDAVPAWADSLLAPLHDLLATADHVVLAPDGALNLVPLVALLADQGIDHCTRVPSASVLADLRRSASGGAGTDAPASLLILHAGELPAAAWESEQLATRYRGSEVHSIVQDDAASLARLVSAADVLHVAAHAEGDDRNAWQSAIICDPSRPDRRWRARDITALSLDLRLVVLASCESAAGRTLSGEGVQGLASAFLAAGAPTVLASLWPVDDDATAFFMTRFYGGLAHGLTALEAHAAAQAACRTDAVFGDPACWAGFVLMGDGEQGLGLAAQTGLGELRRWLLWPLLAVLGMGFWLIVRRGRG